MGALASIRDAIDTRAATRQTELRRSEEAVLALRVGLAVSATKAAELEARDEQRLLKTVAARQEKELDRWLLS